MSTRGQLRAVVGGGVDVGLGVDAGAPGRRRHRAARAVGRDASVRSTTVGTSHDREVARAAPTCTVVAVGETTAADADHRVVAVPAGDLDERRPRRPARSAGKNASTAISPVRSDDSSGPTKKSPAGDRRVGPPGRRASTDPPSRRSTAGISAAGSACTSVPTVVPRLRIVGCATCSQRLAQQRLHAACAGVGQHARRAGPARRPGRRRRRCRRRRGPASRLMSTSVAGAPAASTAAAPGSARRRAPSRPGRRPAASRRPRRASRGGA